MGKFKISKDKIGQWRFALIADNGKIVAVGEGYKNKSGLKKGIACIKRISRDAKIIEE
jgi:hypothetical protein